MQSETSSDHTRTRFHSLATVATYLVPDVYPDRDQIVRRIDMSRALKIASENPWVRIYPGAVDLQDDGSTRALSSRTVCSLGVGEDLEQARENSLVGISNIDGNKFRFRKDVASREHIQKSIEHVKSFENS